MNDNKKHAKSIKTLGYVTAVFIIVISFVLVAQLSGVLQLVVLLGGFVLALNTGNTILALGAILEENIKTNEMLADHLKTNQPDNKTE